jgi:hypothetical protein
MVAVHKDRRSQQRFVAQRRIDVLFAIEREINGLTPVERRRHIESSLTA